MPVNLVTDRTQADVQERNAKGTYNASDINRVNDAVEEVAAAALQMLTDLEAYRESMGVADDPIFQPYAAEDVVVELPVISEEDPTLPAGYTELEYIQADNTRSAWIDTGFAPNNNTRLVVDCEIEKASSSATYIFGLSAYEPSANYQLRIISTAQYLTADYGGSSKNFPVIPAGRYTVDMNKNVCTVGDNTVTNAEDVFQSASSLLFLASTTTSGGRLGSPGTIYAAQVYDNGTLIRDFYPCKNPSGEVGLYDIVGQQFYGNAGTGAFTAGPEAETPVTTRTVWERQDIPYPAQMTQYLANITTLRGLLPITGPEVPADMVRLTFQEANAIEEILLLVAQAIQDFQANAEDQIDYIGTYANQLVSGTFYAGNYRTLQHFSRGR